MDFRLLDPGLVWTLWIAVSIVSTGLLLKGDINYPLHLLFAHLLVAQILQICLRCFNKNTKWKLDFSRSGLVSSLALSGLLVAGLMNGYKAIVLSNDLPNLVLLLTLDTRPSALLGKIIERKLSVGDALRYLVLAVGMCLVCVCNFRLRAVPLDNARDFLIFMGLAEVVWDWDLVFERRPCLRLIGEEEKRWPDFWIAIALVVVGIMAVSTGYVRPEWVVWSVPTAVMTLVSFTAVSSLLAYGFAGEESALAGGMPTDRPQGVDMKGCLIRLAITGCVCTADSLLASRPAVISFWQYSGYLMGTLAFTTGDDIRWLRDHIFDRALDSQDQRSFRRLCLLAAVTWLWFVAFSFMLTPPPLQSIDLALSPSPAPASQLDIVIARYAEPAANVADVLESLLAVDSMSGLEASVTIYNKNNDTQKFDEALRMHLSSEFRLSVEALDNIGREGDTYLHHIVTNWDSLADHTLFAQAEIEYLDLALNWLDQFFVPETGFLTLSYEGVICKSCEYCHDYGWSEDPAVITEVYSSVHPGLRCQDLVLTYRGQSVVSGARIRVNEKGVYENLLRRLRDPGSDLHSPAYTGSMWHSDLKDSLNDPVFGFTLERMWGVLMHCSELRVGYWSPSRFAAWMRPEWLAGRFPLDQVQCLDQPVEQT